MYPHHNETWLHFQSSGEMLGAPCQREMGSDTSGLRDLGEAT
jgi:hypothetical protein